MTLVSLLVCSAGLSEATSLSEAAGADAGAARAKEIMIVTDIKGGLVVHVGCGDGTLTVALAAGEGYLVHAMAQ